MSHKFDPSQKQKLLSAKRYEILPPAETLDKFGLGKGMVFADIGCGAGFFTLPAAEMVRASGHVYAVDISPEMLQETRQRALEKGLNNIEYLLSSETEIPIPDDTVDMVLLAAVLHELRNPVQFGQELKRLLKKDGKLAVIEWKKEVTGMGPPVADRLSPEDTEVILRSCGFTNTTVIALQPAHYGIVAS